MEKSHFIRFFLNKKILNIALSFLTIDSFDQDWNILKFQPFHWIQFPYDSMRSFVDFSSIKLFCLLKFKEEELIFHITLSDGCCSWHHTDIGLIHNINNLDSSRFVISYGKWQEEAVWITFKVIIHFQYHKKPVQYKWICNWATPTVNPVRNLYEIWRTSGILVSISIRYGILSEVSHFSWWYTAIVVLWN